MKKITSKKDAIALVDEIAWNHEGVKLSDSVDECRVLYIGLVDDLHYSWTEIDVIAGTREDYNGYYKYDLVDHLFKNRKFINANNPHLFK